MADNSKAKVTTAPSINHQESIIKKGWINRIPLLGVVILVLIVGVVLLITKEANHDNTAFVIDQKNYSKQLISEMSSFATTDTKGSNQQAAKSIFKLYETEIASKQVGISPTTAAIQAQNIALPTPKNSDDRQYVALVKYNAALGASYRQYTQGDDQGDYFVFNFSRYIVPPPAQGKPVAGRGSTALIAQDTAYAYRQAQADYKAYKAGKITASNLLSKIESDPNLTYNSPGGIFNSSTANASLLSQIYYMDIYQYVVAQTKPQLSAIRVGKVPTSYTGSTDYVNGYYYFVDLKKATKIVPNPNGLIAQQINKLQATYYGI